MLDKSDLIALSKAIRDERVKRNWSRPDLAAKLGTSPRKIESYESYGKKNYQAPTETMINALNKAFGFEPAKPVQKKSMFERVKALLGIGTK